MSLIELVEAGDLAGVVRELGGLTPAQRKENDVALATRRAVMNTEWNRYSETEMDAQLAAELGCQDSASAAADWLCVIENRRMSAAGRADGTWLVDVIDLRPVEWRVELAGLLSERLQRGWAGRFAFLEHLIHDTGCPVPTSDAFLTSWLGDRGSGHQERPAYLKGGVRGADLRERLRGDPWTAMLLPLAVARPGAELPLENLAEISLAEPGLIDRDVLAVRCYALLSDTAPWYLNSLKAMELTPAEHAKLSAPRAELLDRGLERLLQDGTRMEVRPWLDLLRLMAPAPAEHAAVARDYLELLDGSPPVADYAQEILAGLDEIGLVERELAGEASERVLLRPEKKLVRAQLSWLDRAAKRDPARAGQVVMAAATAFDHRDAALQERALAVVGRHFKAAGESVLPELRAAAERLGPVLSARAAELLGMPSDGAAEPLADVLPVVPEPRPVPGPLATVAEVAEEVAAVIAGDQDVVAFERALDGLVRHAHLDRAALAAALEPVSRKEPRWRFDCAPEHLYAVARAVADPEPYEYFLRRGNGEFSLAGELLAARLVEAGELVASGAQPFLLAVPTLSTGALDAAVLVERLAACEGLGVTPGRVDLAQALLRVTPAADRQVLSAAENLGSEAGKRLAAWLRAGGLPHQDSEPSDWDTARKRWRSPARPGLTLDPPMPKEVAKLLGPYERRKHYVVDPPEAFWFAQLPHHRDVVAARDYVDSRQTDRGWTAALPFMAESGGPAGFAVHMVLAQSTSTSRPADRGPAVDAMLVLAARGQLDATLLGRQIAVRVHEGGVLANRLVETLRTMADTGAHGTVWAVLEGALPGLLGDKPVRGAAELLALAVECASHCGASGEVAEVTAVAQRTGSSLVVKNARALREVLLRTGHAAR
ncbi:DUF6493 family protein [Streptosporangium subroseum]|uniref:DUF6493 family protein n=1 Tax=Streptosporangium subroseum TaxID=106412 RepID=UPI00341F727C